MGVGFVIGGTASGVGKTTVAASITAALTARGLRVQPFKAGPDYIDPTYLERAAGRPCRNLDTWMLPHAAVRELFTRAAGAADIALIEGVMGLYDGHRGGSDEGSTAALARLLGLPVVLVIDARAMARSAAAMVLGYQQFAPDVTFAGVVLNRIGSPTHAALCTEAIEATTGLPVLGALPRDAEVAIPERHLGLVPEIALQEDALTGSLARLAEQHIDLDALLRRAAVVQPVSTVTADATPLFPQQPVTRRATIAIAQDEAFHFYYRDGLDLLEAWGAELVPFSPLADEPVPPAADAVYIGGGFPELYAGALAAATHTRDALQAAAARDVPIYGECGGLMYLGQTLTGFNGEQHAMTGLLPAASRMTQDRLSLGYRTVRSHGTPVLPAGEVVRGHEFHWSVLDAEPAEEGAAHIVLDDPASGSVTGGVGRAEGFVRGSVTATYVHLHFAARTDLAPNFVAAAAAAAGRQNA